MARFFTVVTILVFTSVVISGGLRTEAQCVDSVIVRNTWASIGSTGVAVPVYAHLCSSDTINTLTFALQYDSSFVNATNIIYEVHDSLAPSFYDVYPDPHLWSLSISGEMVTLGVIFDLFGVGGIINPPEGRYRMFDLIFDVVAQDTGITVLDIISASLGNKTPVLVDGIFNVTLSGVEGSFQPHTNPKLLALCQNYPNPFNSVTNIGYRVPNGRSVSSAPFTLKIYDIGGRLVRVLVNEREDPGYHSTIWDGRDNQGKEVASGVYLCRLRNSNLGQARKLVLLR